MMLNIDDMQSFQKQWANLTWEKNWKVHIESSFEKRNITEWCELKEWGLKKWGKELSGEALVHFYLCIFRACEKMLGCSLV